MLQRVRKALRALAFFPVRHHFWGSLLIVLTVCFIVSTQITDRRNFANSELYQDVIERWGAPINQPVPSVRYVASGSVFNTLEKLPLASQRIVLDAAMSYRKRGLVYFSGFDFSFLGQYSVRNDKGHDIDIVFVFPIDMEKNRVLLSDLQFLVNGTEKKIDLSAGADKLVWTGRVKNDEEIGFDIRFRGRGLDSFVYRLDPSLPVRNLDVTINVSGGDNYDYPTGVMPARAVTMKSEDALTFSWKYASLESGVAVGIILPSEKSFDAIIATMLRRSWATFILFFFGLVGLSLFFQRQLLIYESYLVAAGYGFFFVLLAYLAAFLNFYFAYGVALVSVVALLFFYLKHSLEKKAALPILALLVSFLAVPTAAVILQGYTGLIYTLEILVGLALLMMLSTRTEVRSVFEEVSK